MGRQKLKLVEYESLVGLDNGKIKVLKYVGKVKGKHCYEVECNQCNRIWKMERGSIRCGHGCTNCRGSNNEIITYIQNIDDYFTMEMIIDATGNKSILYTINKNPEIREKYNKLLLNESKYKFVMFLRGCCKTFDDNDILQMMAKQTYFSYLSEFPELECIHNKWYVDMKSESSIDSKVIVDDSDDIIDLWNSNDFDSIDLDVCYEDDSLKIIMDYIDNFSDDYFTIDNIPVPKNVWSYRRKVNKKVNEFHQAFFKSKLTIKKPTQINE